jgi:hypothetical protein
LLKRYGELSPEQRAALAQGLPFTALTPPQQALFLQFAQRCRPFVETWRFQQGSLQLIQGPSPIKDDGRGAAAVSRALFQVRFGEGDPRALPMDLFLARGKTRGFPPAANFVGKPFPGFRPNNRIQSPGDDPVWQPALNNPRLRDRPSLIVVTRPYAEPYVGAQPPPSTVAWSRKLAERLQGTGITVAHLTVGPKAADTAAAGAVRMSNLLLLWEEGDVNGEPFNSAGASEFVPQSPTIFLVDREGIVRAVLEGMQSWDVAAVERATRALVTHHNAAVNSPQPLPGVSR